MSLAHFAVGTGLCLAVGAFALLELDRPVRAWLERRLPRS